MSTTGDDLLTTLEPTLRSALQAAEQKVQLASPYIGASTLLWLQDLALRSAAEWQVLVRLDPVAVAYGSLHLPGLLCLLEAGAEIRHLDNLHAKLFLTEASGFVGSANLTAAGLGVGTLANAELTVALSPRQQAAAGEIYQVWYDAAEIVTPQLIRECEQQAAELPAKISRPPGQTAEAEARVDLGDELLELATDVSVWIKAVDDAGHGWEPGDWISNSKRAKFSVGDLVVVYGKAQQACTAVLQVDKLAYYDPQVLRDAGYSEENANRWPWISDVTCLLEFSEPRYVPITELGKTAKSLQGGYCRMPVGGLAAALRYAL
ncbi:hypothetical protein ACFCV3_03560 [Kribbella sp. NPDC056345]|uniref:hypothetical protein n=1 Tax=Kribbella sp. NPDC056345 TaxID=3345789 RepID=UPI0035DAEABD